MKKHWLQNDKQAIKKSFLTFSKEKVNGDVPETYSLIDDNNNLCYFYQTSNRFQSSWSNSDVTTCHSYYSREQLKWIIRVYIGLLVPRLKSKYVGALSEIVLNSMKKGDGKNINLWYDSYSYDSVTLDYPSIANIAESYLKQHDLFREKNEFNKL